MDFFFGILNCTTWVVVDHVTFTARSRQSRCRIKSNSGISLLPITVKHPCNKPISSTIIDNQEPWRKRFLKSIIEFYADTPFFPDYFSGIKELIERPNVLLETLTLDTCIWASEMMDKKIEYVRTSDIRRPHGELYTKNFPPSHMIPLLINKMEGQIFNVPFEHPYYPQKTDAFEPDLSILDVFFNIGAENAKMLLTLEDNGKLSNRRLERSNRRCVKA